MKLKFQKIVMTMLIACFSLSGAPSISFADSTPGATSGGGTDSSTSGSGSGSSSSSSSSNPLQTALCKTSGSNPISVTTVMDWNNLFPVSFLGYFYDGSYGNINSPLMWGSPYCYCPTDLYGYPFYGIVTTYWEPSYLVEVERRSGCLSSLGTQINTSMMLQSEEASGGKVDDASANRMQVHWIIYPVMALLDIFENMICKQSKGFNIGYMTEYDSYWQDDVESAVASPESDAFTGVDAQLACAVDSISSVVGIPLDPLIWCAGTWGGLYPMTGNSNHAGDNFAYNNLIAMKFIARSHRFGLMWQTIGPDAICSSHINPVIIKSMYRLNQVAPVARSGRAVATGDFGRVLTWPFVTHAPTQEHSVSMVWQGMQCCIRF